MRFALRALVSGQSLHFPKKLVIFLLPSVFTGLACFNGVFIVELLDCLDATGVCFEGVDWLFLEAVVFAAFVLGVFTSVSGDSGRLVPAGTG